MPTLRRNRTEVIEPHTFGKKITRPCEIVLAVVVAVLTPAIDIVPAFRTWLDQAHAAGTV